MSVQLSIIVPAYNAECYLEDCLNSILVSTYRDFEILLVDDGSADATAEICDRYRRKHPQIRVFHTENQKLPSARNIGLENATGRFIGFVDADDLVAPDMFARMVYAMREDVQIGMCQFRKCTRLDARDVFVEETPEAKDLSREETAEYILRGKAGPYVWNKLYRRDILERNGIRFRPDAQGAEDLFFNAEYLQYCDKATCIEEELYCYITTEGSITDTFRTSRVVNDRYMSLPRAWCYAAEIMKDISKELMTFAQAKAAMYYQTVLRKLEKPDEMYIREARAYVKEHNHALRHSSWGRKYYCSGLVLRMGYPLWARIFRRGMGEVQRKTGI